MNNSKFKIQNSKFLLFSAFCFLLISVQAQELPSEIFGEYIGDVNISNTTFGIDQTLPDISVKLEETGTEEDYFLKILDIDIIDTLQIAIEMDKIIITPYEGGYKLSRAESITFTIPEVYVPPIPPLLPEGGVFYDVPVKVSLGNSQLEDFVLKLKLEVVATLTIVIIVPIPIPITFNIEFEGQLFSPPIITTTVLPNGTMDEAYSATLEADGATPISWSIVNGDLPAGLSLNSETGVISGTPTEADVFCFIVQATNTSGIDSREFCIEIEDIDTVGIHNAKMADLKVCPNPTTGELVVSSEYRVVSIEIFDIYGRKLSQIPNFTSIPPAGGGDLSHYSLLTTHYSMDISYLPAGIYFLRITTEQGEVIRKVVKE
ncbi:MAG: putative Ig domain-containing protein [Bacteroidales bacterium]|nr:putative Ig domain-containing protein [Bacteroidales bacterium]